MIEIGVIEIQSKENLKLLLKVIVFIISSQSYWKYECHDTQISKLLKSKVYYYLT